MSEKTNLCLEGSLAVWTENVSRMWSGSCWLSSVWLASVVLQQQFCLPHMLQACSAFVHGEEPLRTVLSSVFLCVGVDGKRFHGYLQIVFETFLLPPPPS